MKNLENELIFEITLINPIESILIKLQNKEFRDCDIKWLNSKLENFTKIAINTFEEKIILPSQTPMETLTVLNDFNYNLYIKYFDTLLSYFKSF